uniref:Photolyase/cryptochrome alpha/beta domain-containing protein n=1 Tax=viral metagenome TaxID=1070528 RepID=A0A6C0IU32_9ZZZZ
MSKFEKETFKTGLFIFRRDLRTTDNIGLSKLNEICEKIIPIFIFTPEQVGQTNKFKSDNSVQFMIESLEDLASDIRKDGGNLLTFYGHNEPIIKQLIGLFDIDCIGFNIDYSPYAFKRDTEIVELCTRLNVHISLTHDYYLHPPGSILNGTGHPYQKFTPYYNTASKIHVEIPLRTSKIHFKTGMGQRLPAQINLGQAQTKFVPHINPHLLVHGGRDNALKQMNNASHKSVAHYSKTHDQLIKTTSQLSAYIKFGCISIREVYKNFKGNKAFIRQLYWRDFYASVLTFFPKVLGSAMNPKYNKIHWHYNANWFHAWKNGKTGFPVVDAGIRQLNETGYMHNRARLIVASFLIKTLLISWEKGEEYFATKLVDYDPASNNLNWQWCASSAIDSQPYFRIFNPWNQQENYDPDCEYIKRWVPELANLQSKVIHNWNTEWKNNDKVGYSKPICNYEEQKEKALKMYKDALY